MTLVTKWKQPIINWPRIKIFAWNFQNIIILVTWSSIWDLSFLSNLTSFVMTFPDHAHPIQTNDIQT